MAFLGLFGNYDKPGPGVDKDEPKKAAPVRFLRSCGESCLTGAVESDIYDPIYCGHRVDGGRISFTGSAFSLCNVVLRCA